MAKSAISLRGVSELQRYLLALAPKTRTEIKQITEATGRLIEARAKQNAPVDTGKGRQSINYQPTRGGFGASISVGEKYMWYHEFGTGGMVSVPDGFEDLAGELKGSGKRQINLPARPFLIPAFLVHQDEYYKAIRAALDRIFR